MKLSRKEWTCIDPDAGVWARTYKFAEKGGYSNAFVLRIGEGQLAIISPPTGLAAEDFDALDGFGELVAIIAPNGFHHLGIPDFVARYPKARLFAHEVTARRIGKKNKAVPPFESMSALEAMLPEHVRIFHPGNMKVPDMMATFDTPTGTIWYSNDVLGNLPALPGGLVGKLFKWTNSGPGFKVNRFVVKLLRPEKGFGTWLAAQFERQPPRVVVPGHGLVVHDGDVPAQCRACVEAGF